MDAREKLKQDYTQMQAQHARALELSREEYRSRVAQASEGYFKWLGLRQKGKRQLESHEEYVKQHEAFEERLLQEYNERNAVIIRSHAQKMDELRSRAAALPDDVVSPFWKVQVVQVASDAPLSLRNAFQEKEVYSVQGLRDYFHFFLDHAEEVRVCSPVLVEVKRITSEDSVFFLQKREEEYRAVYHIDFRQEQQRDLIGQNLVQVEVAGAWVRLGGRFIQSTWDYSGRRPVHVEDHIHHPFPEMFRD